MFCQVEYIEAIETSLVKVRSFIKGGAKRHQNKNTNQNGADEILLKCAVFVN